MQIVDEDEPTKAWRPWEPPIWLIAVGLAAALLVGLAVAQRVSDPRVGQASATPCVPTAVQLNAGTSFVWSSCPPR